MRRGKKRDHLHRDFKLGLKRVDCEEYLLKTAIS